MSHIGVVDLFCGIGGLSLGLKNSGMTIVAGVDSDETCMEVYKRNIKAPFIHSDISRIHSRTLSNLYAGTGKRLLAACAPCQPFSKYTENLGEDHRWKLLMSVMSLVTDIRPEFVLLENVTRIQKHPVWAEICRIMTTLDYKFSTCILDASAYGVPQRRERTILLASRQGAIPNMTPKLAQPRSVREAIANLPILAHGQQNSHDLLHAARRLTATNVERIMHSLPDGTWKDWPESLRLSCHVANTGKTYRGIYGRLAWDRPAPTITTQFFGYGNGRFGHPEQNRALSLREGALLQSFPTSFDFFAGDNRLNFNKTGRHIGNAVPPLLSTAVGDHMIRYAAGDAGKT